MEIGIYAKLRNLRGRLILKNRNEHIFLQVHEKSSNSVTLGEGPT